MKHVLPLTFCALLCAEVLDRVAVSIGNQVITESQLSQEIRLDSFLNNEPPDFSTASKRAAADRLIEQKLVRKEMEMGRYPAASAQEAADIIQNLLKTRASDAADFDRQLKAAGITLAELQEHLLWGLTLSHFIDLRFRPAVQVTGSDVEKYYREQVLPKAGGPQKPSLADVRTSIEESLRAERSDSQLDAWLKDIRSHTTIDYAKEVFGGEGTK
jgi:hypothetical protein